MIPTESLMLIALGAGLGLLVALVVGRGLWILLEKNRLRRARRTFPIEISNLQAERDRVQTEAILAVQNLEKQLEGAKALLTENIGNLARQRNHIDALTLALAGRDRQLAAKTTALALAEDRMVNLGSGFESPSKTDKPLAGDYPEMPGPADPKTSEERLRQRIRKLMEVAETLEKERVTQTPRSDLPDIAPVSGSRRDGLPPANLFPPPAAHED